MNTPEDIKKIIAPYTAAIDSELQKLFTETSDLKMYEHLAYFMGFRNAQLEPEVVYGGKRFRSSMMLMLGEWYAAQSETLPFATALELYHNFTLIHDDVVDKDTHRRGRPTVWYLFGHDHAINSGDAQLVMVAELLASSSGATKSGPAAQAFMLRQFRTVIEGQFLDFELTGKKLGEVAVNQTAYEEMIRCKTAELIVAAFRGAGILSKKSEEECNLLEVCGRSLGMAYQICDDTYSIWSTSENTGKRNYGDIKERKKTLPILFAHEKLAAADREKMETIFAGTNELKDSDCEEVIVLLDKVETRQHMEVVIAQYADAAKAAARKLLVTSEQQETLCDLVDSLLPKV